MAVTVAMIVAVAAVATIAVTVAMEALVTETIKTEKKRSNNRAVS